MCPLAKKRGESQQELSFSATVYSTVIEISSTVLCDCGGNEFSMAVIFLTERRALALRFESQIRVGGGEGSWSCRCDREAGLKQTHPLSFLGSLTVGNYFLETKVALNV